MLTKHKHQIIGIILLIIILFSCSRPDSGHTCRWRMCPYKNILPNQWQREARMYNGDSDDGYRLDMLHLQYPTKEYEELEEMYEIEQITKTI